MEINTIIELLKHVFIIVFVSIEIIEAIIDIKCWVQERRGKNVG